MTLTRLSLHNYMTHRDLTEDFSGNLIALTGEMGHGKSTFVGAIQFCLTGEHPPWHREDLLSWGSTEGSAKLYFTQNGTECSILRKLHTSEVVLKIGDDTVTGAKNVEKALAVRLGVDKDILKQIGFVQQYEVQSILFDDPSKRERSFQKLLGIGDASKIWTELGPIIQSYSRSENFESSIASLRQMVSRLEGEISTVDTRLGQAADLLKLMPSRDEQTREMERLLKIQANMSSLDTLKSRLDSLNRESAAKMQELIDNKNSEETIKNSLGCTVDDLDKFVEQSKTEYTKVQSELNSLKKLSGASETNGLCPLCGNPVAPGSIASHVANELSRLEAEVSAAMTKYRDDSSAATQVKTKLAALEQSRKSIESRITAISSSIEMMKEQEKKTLLEFGSLGLSPDADFEKIKAEVDGKLNEARSIISQYDDLTRQVSSLEGENNAKKAQLEQASKALSDKEKEQELSAPMAHRLEVLTNVRNWFHSSNGPRTMSVSAVKALTGYVNEYLMAMRSEIEVLASDDGFSFVFRYLDGRPVSDPLPSTSKLSGGQKIELALAFRLAIYRCFGQQMGIMVLDEPTAHLSPAGITYFGELLKTVSVLAKNMNLQIIMPTHEKEILPFMDYEIHFS